MQIISIAMGNLKLIKVMWKFMHFVFQKVLHVRVIIINQLVLHSSCVNLMFLRICYHVVCAFFPTVYSFINNISCTN